MVSSETVFVQGPVKGARPLATYRRHLRAVSGVRRKFWPGVNQLTSARSSRGYTGNQSTAPNATGDEMFKYKVKRLRAGVWDQNDPQELEADTAKEAAEHSCGVGVL